MSFSRLHEHIWKPRRIEYICVKCGAFRKDGIMNKKTFHKSRLEAIE